MKEEFEFLDEEYKTSDGRYKCPNCGSTDIKYDKKKKKLVCSNCREILDDVKLDSMIDDISKLKGNYLGRGAKTIKEENDLITIKCSSCGAEVVVDSKISPYTKCPWCRSLLSLDTRVENGAVPDLILPFSVSKEEAIIEIKKYVNERKRFASTDFMRNLNLDEVQGLYLPYVVVDTKAYCTFINRGEYSDDIYRFSAIVNDLTIEANDEYTIDSLLNNTNHIINSIMPFDTEKCVKFKSNYLISYSSIKRNIDLNEIDEKINKQIKEICEYQIQQKVGGFPKLQFEEKNINILGKQIVISYLPVWLYSYKEKTNGKQKTHYIAVNGRTKEIAGSIPYSNSLVKALPLLIFGVIFIALLSFLMNIITLKVTVSPRTAGNLVFLSEVLIYSIPIFICIWYRFIYKKYLSRGSKHHYEKETDVKIENLEYMIKNKYQK